MELDAALSKAEVEEVSWGFVFPLLDWSVAAL